MRCGFACAGVPAGVTAEVAAPAPKAATPPATKLRRLIVGSPLPTLPRMRGRVGRIAAADPSQHLQAKTDRRDMPVSCIGASHYCGIAASFVQVTRLAQTGM